MSRLVCVLACSTALLACGPVTPGDGDGGVKGFDGHAHVGAVSLAELERLMATGPGSSKAKFVVTDFPKDAARSVSFLDGAFYALHDEWYWFHLMNGQRPPGVDTEPVTGHSFATVDEIVTWARAQVRLPLDLAWVEGGSRLYSPLFYDLALRTDRALGLGGIVKFPARAGRAETWVFELEYPDRITHPDLVRYFRTLEAALPAPLGAQVKWVVRSPQHQQVADEMKAGRLAYWDRIVRYDDLIVAGEVEVYAPGLTAGIPKLVRAGESLAGGTNEDLLILEDVPDELPPCAGLVTSVPQTPLAHIALLSRNRGIPDAFLGGAIARPDLDQLSRARAPVILQAIAPDQLRLEPITRAEYAAWKDLRRPAGIVVPAIELTNAPVVVDLSDLSYAQAETLRPLIGGKNAGMAALVRALPDPKAPLSAPPAPFAITVKAYVDHLAPLRSKLEALLVDPSFSTNSATRVLALEGEEEYDLLYPTAVARQWRKDLIANRADGDALKFFVQQGGVRQAIRTSPMPVDTLAAITTEIEKRYGYLAPTQALRFRSSSNVEDAQGFNAAGIYDSNSGFLHPEAQPASGDRKKTVAWAIRKTWASYWSVAAFEERRGANVAHLAGAMGIVVHPEFDDAIESANGVLTATLRRDGGRPSLRVEIDSQPGAQSVTNPTSPSYLPEIVLVDREEAAGTPEIKRIRAATLSAGGAPVLSDAELLALTRQAGALADEWLDGANAGLDAAHANRVIVLDLEYRRVKAGWPAVVSGEPMPARLILKQVRSLDPEAAPVAAGLRLPAPGEVLARARRIERRTCIGPSIQSVVISAFTDPNRLPDLGHAEVPFVVSAAFFTVAAQPALGLDASVRVDLDHTMLATVDHPASSGWSTRAQLTEAAAASAGFDGFSVRESGEWELRRGEAVVTGNDLTCGVAVLFTTPEDYLLSLLER